MTEMRFYSVYQRAWHWTQAILVLVLVATGAQIHFPDRLRLLAFDRAVATHDAAGLAFLANAFLGLFYYVTTGEIRQLLPGVRGFASSAAAQARFYLGGIFRGDAHPFERKPERRLNPLQRLTYLAILNVLLPLQAGTGLLMWAAGRWPGGWEAPSGLGALAFVHTAGAWLLAGFLVGHLYLISTGRTPAANLKTMVSGREEIEERGAKREVRS